MDSKQAKAAPTWPEFFGEFGLSISKALMDSKRAKEESSKNILEFFLLQAY